MFLMGLGFNMIEKIYWHSNPLNVCKSPRFTYGDFVMLKTPYRRLDTKLIVSGRQYFNNHWKYLAVCPVAGFGGWFTEPELSMYRVREII